MSQIGIVFGKKHAPWTRIDNSGAIIDPDASFFSNHPTFAGIADDDIDGQSMVRVPAFYYRSDIVRDGPLLGKKALWVSDEPAEGYALHPAFRNHGADLAQFWLGKYQGTPDGDDKLGSQAGLMPLARIDFPTMQARAAARGDGWMLWSIYQLAAIQALALIECGTPNVKSILGEGYTDGNGVRKVDDAEVVQAAYRGITGLWGNVWQMLDGLQTSANRAPAGKPAGTRRNGYVRIRIAGKDYNAHRLAWLYMYGVWPEKLVDHINGRRDDNRIGNLRELSNTENQQNRRRAARHSSTGLIGVSQGRREGTFRAHITLNRERQFLGHFSDPLQAQQAYIDAKRCLHPFGTI